MRRKRDAVTEAHERIKDGSIGTDWVRWYLALPDEEKQSVLKHLKQVTGAFYELEVAARSVAAAFEEVGKQASRTGECCGGQCHEVS